eukprot:3004039-Pleurochrysis_carterae.AAC.1
MYTDRFWHEPAAFRPATIACCCSTLPLARLHPPCLLAQLVPLANVPARCERGIAQTWSSTR